MCIAKTNIRNLNVQVSRLLCVGEVATFFDFVVQIESLIELASGICVCAYPALQQFYINIHTFRGNSGKWNAADKLLITQKSIQA